MKITVDALYYGAISFIALFGLYLLVRVLTKAAFKSYFETKKEFNNHKKEKEDNHEV